MQFLEIEHAFSFTDGLLSKLQKEGFDTAELEMHFVRSIVTLIVSEYEVFIEDIFNERATQCEDTEIINFVNVTISRVFRSPEICKISDNLKKLSDDIKNKFCNKNRDISYIAQNEWDNIMKARHAIVHKSGILQMTYSELKKSYIKSLEIINNLIEVLKV